MSAGIFNTSPTVFKWIFCFVSKKKKKQRYVTYVHALGHLLSTGQGVVIERSFYSDIIFTEALLRHNLISKVAHKALHEVRGYTEPEVLKPHLVIYLDVPVDKTLVCGTTMIAWRCLLEILANFFFLFFQFIRRTLKSVISIMKSNLNYSETTNI